MTVFKNVDAVLNHFDERAKFFQGLSEKNSDDKTIQKTTQIYVKWRISIVNKLQDEGYEKAAELVNSLRGCDGNQLFSVPLKQPF